VHSLLPPLSWHLLFLFVIPEGDLLLQLQLQLPLPLPLLLPLPLQLPLLFVIP
jgi:hypothetical protein